MSYAHLTESTNTNKLNVFCNNLNAAGTSTQGAINCTSLTASGTVAGLGMTVGDNGIASSGGITVTRATGNAVMTLSAPVGQASAVNYTVAGVLAGSVAADADGLTINGALSDPTFDINILTSAANNLRSNTSYSYQAAVFVDIVSSTLGNPSTAPTRKVFRAQCTNFSVAAGSEAAILIPATANIITANNLFRVSILGTGPTALGGIASNSSLVYTGNVWDAGNSRQTLVFQNPSATGTGAFLLDILVEVLVA